MRVICSLRLLYTSWEINRMRCIVHGLWPKSNEIVAIVDLLEIICSYFCSGFTPMLMLHSKTVVTTVIRCLHFPYYQLPKVLFPAPIFFFILPATQLPILLLFLTYTNTQAFRFIWRFYIIWWIFYSCRFNIYDLQ